MALERNGISQQNSPTPEPDLDEQLVGEWQKVLPDTVPPFELIARSRLAKEAPAGPAVDGEEGSTADQPIYDSSDIEEEMETFPCDCHYNPECACGPKSKCINRELFIECSSEDCPAGSHCQNQRFQKRQYAKVQVVFCGAKGHGLRALEDLKQGDFVMEYVGEILGKKGFRRRVQEAEAQNQRHFYFMTIRNGRVIDASQKGNLARFMNHSCAPNCETQKWTVGGRLHVGLFARQSIRQGTELTFDYKFVRFGQAAQQCFCGEPQCKGIIGEEAKEPIAALAESDSEAESVASEEGLDSELLADPEAQLQGLAQVPLLVKALLRSESPGNVKDILSLLVRTDSSDYFEEFLHFHGLKVLASVSTDLFRTDGGAKVFIKLLSKLPVADKKPIEESGILKALAAAPTGDPGTEALKTEIERKWELLRKEYHIPRKPTPAPSSDSRMAMSPVAAAGHAPYVLEVPEEFRKKKKPSLPMALSIPNRTRERQERQFEGKRDEFRSSPSSKPSDSVDRRRHDDYPSRRRSRSPSGVMTRGSRDSPPRRDHSKTAPMLIPGWHAASAPDGKTYYYHEQTKQTQWDPPLIDAPTGLSPEQAARLVDIHCDLARQGRPVDGRTRSQLVDDVLREFKTESFYDLSEGRRKEQAERYIGERLYRLLR